MVVRALDAAETKPSYEYLEFMLDQRKLELSKARETIREKEEEAKRLRLVLRGISDEQFHLRVTLSPEIFNQNSFEAVQHLVRHHAKMTAYAIEEKLGGPIRELQEALMHIHYLENHARAGGLRFTEWTWKDMHRGLLY